MHVYQFTADYPPSANHRTRLAPRRTAKGKTVIRPVKTERAMRYEDQIGWLARKAGVREIVGPVAIELHLYRPALDSSTTNKRPVDVDNACKSVLDGLAGVAFENDRQVTELHVYAHDDDPAPRLEVTICEADAAGLVLLRARGVSAIEAGAIVDVMEMATKGDD